MTRPDEAGTESITSDERFERRVLRDSDAALSESRNLLPRFENLTCKEKTGTLAPGIRKTSDDDVPMKPSRLFAPLTDRAPRQTCLDATTKDDAIQIP
jgi:glyoxylate carboligase